MRDTRVLNHRMLCWTERVALLLIVLYMCGHTMPKAWRGLITDFPNYYLAARMAHEGYDTSRMYEWDWLQREKDHRAIDIRLIGLAPITPFSTLVMLPLMGLKPLAAKRVWILFNLALLLPIGWLLRSFTGLPYRRIALVLASSVPLYRNLEFGQFYVLLLLLLVAACWAYLRGFHAVAGALTALAAACKIFPVLFFVLFLQRRDWRALLGSILAGLAAMSLSVAVFGWNVHRTYLHEILPWGLQGGGLQPYAVQASISGVLHYLFLSEPEWNPHPWHYSPLCYALLLPALQMLAVAPAILFLRRERDSTQTRILLEWSALLTASLTISTMAASYNFVLMAMPVCILASILHQSRRYGWLVVLLLIYLGIGFPTTSPHGPVGLAVLLYVPRLALMFVLLFGIYVLLWRDSLPESALSEWNWTRFTWAGVLAVSAVFTARSTFRIERAVRQEFAYRLPLQTQGYLNADSRPTGTGVRYIAFTVNGYRLITEDQAALSVDPSGASPDDDLSFTSGPTKAGPDTVLVERARNGPSNIVDLKNPSHVIVEDAHHPMLSLDGQSLAFTRDDHGRGRLMLRRNFASKDTIDFSLTPSLLNVYEVSFLSEGEYAFSAVEDGRTPEVYLNDATHINAPLALGESRYPSLSPDGRWLAYSHLEDGAWNLWVRDRRSGVTRRVADVPCNQIQPAWEADSRTLLYSTDCGRSLWFTAVARRQVIP